MKLVWYRWHGHAAQDFTDQRQGLIKARHSSGVHLQAWRQHHRVRRLRALSKVGKGRLAQLRFWSSWFNRWHSLVCNGFDMAQSLQQLHSQSIYQEEAELSAAALQGLYKGLPITHAFKRAAVPIAPRYLQSMEFAEQAGQFEHVLAQLSTTTEQVKKAVLQLRQALLYPSAVLTMLLILGLALKLLVLPKFAALYAETNAELPALTQLLLTPASSVSITSILAAACTFVGLSLFIRLWAPVFIIQPSLRNRLRYFSSWYKYVELNYIQQDLNALALALQHGMTLQQGILSVALTHASSWHQQLWLQSLQALRAGKNSAVIFKCHQLSEAEYALIELGEKTGTLEQKLMQVAKAQQQAIDQRIQNMLQLLPNVVLIVVSILTGTVMIALYLPLFQLGLVVG